MFNEKEREMLTATSVESLSARLSGRVVTASDADWDATRQVFNLAMDLSPVAVVLPRDASDVIATVDYARTSGLRVAPQATGHNADAARRRSRTRSSWTSASSRRSRIDADARRVRVGAGVKWGRVAPELSELGLAALHGSSPDVGVAGYSLGGGMGWLARQVRPAGEQRHRDRARHRGGARGPRRRRARARPVLGAARRQRQLRRRHGDRVRRLPRRGAVRGGDVLPLRARVRGSPHLERARCRRCRTR